jgi:hypothetical protein
VKFSLSDAERILDALYKIDETHEQVGLMLAAIASLGANVSKANDELTQLQAQLSDTTADVLAKLDQLTQQLGDLPADAQATLDAIKAGVQQLDATVGDADGSDGAAPAQPEQPAEPTA